MLNKPFFVIILLTLTLLFGGADGSMLHAQGNDPILAGMIALYTDKAKKELKQQEKMMLLEATGHIWITEEVNATTDLQKEFNKYLDDFHSIISLFSSSFNIFIFFEGSIIISISFLINSNFFKLLFLTDNSFCAAAITF